MSETILMIGGADFTAGFVTEFAAAIARQSTYEISWLHPGQDPGRPAVPPKVFTKINRFPTLVRPHNMREALQLLVDAAGTRGGALFDASGRGVRNRFVARARQGLNARVLGPALREYDLVHWHCLVPELLSALDWLPKQTPLVLSLWGSDLYRTAGLGNYASQLAAVERSSIVTMASLEMRETFLAKFGRQHADKVRLTRYGSSMVDAIDERRQCRQQFRAALDIAGDKVVVCIGHNGTSLNQHRRVLQALRTMDDAALARLCLLLPAAYGMEAGYRKELRLQLAGLPCESHLLDRFLSDDELADLRCSIDIMIHVPISDQFSAAMSESLYAGAVLITGAWLPYSSLRVSEIHFHEIPSIDALPARLTQVLDSLVQERALAEANAPRIRPLIDWNALTPDWLQVYHELLSLSP